VRARTIGVGQQQRELLATDARDRVNPALGGCHQRADGSQGLVAGWVPEAVVDLLEVARC
jgi:hypothetical protein